jgi:DNA-directed RNA polymerase subunit RPC12/RpoP
MGAAIVQRYPTKLQVRCPQCSHAGVVEVFLDKPPKLKCTKCGSRDAIVVTRDRTRTWSGQRRGKT